MGRRQGAPSGRPLADALGYRFVDAYQFWSSFRGTSIANVFRTDGESRSVSLGLRVLARSAAPGIRCLATVGGRGCERENWAQLRTSWLLLDDRLPSCARKAERHPTPRPLIRPATDPPRSLAELMAHDTPLYAQATAEIPADAGRLAGPTVL